MSYLKSAEVNLEYGYLMKDTSQKNSAKENLYISKTIGVLRQYIKPVQRYFFEIGLFASEIKNPGFEIKMKSAAKAFAGLIIFNIFKPYLKIRISKTEKYKRRRFG